jgi:nucleotide-binding universal stress UspA family protein
MLYLAYDGSLNGDWVARYAVRFAAHVGRALTLLHVEDDSLDEKELAGKVERLDRECRAQGVELYPQSLPRGKSVFFTLLDNIPAGNQSRVVCGTRVRSRNQAFLTGTISEKLLRCGRFDVLAIRVVQPGLLGSPREFLLPMAGHPSGFQAIWPFFRLFLPEVDRVCLLRAMQVNSLRLPHLSRQRQRALREAGNRYLDRVAEEIGRRRGKADFRLDSRVRICDDWVREVLLQASDLKVRMVLLGATERSIGHRLLHGDALERVLHGTPCDIGIYRSV